MFVIFKTNEIKFNSYSVENFSEDIYDECVSLYILAGGVKVVVDRMAFI